MTDNMLTFPPGKPYDPDNQGQYESEQRIYLLNEEQRALLAKMVNYTENNGGPFISLDNITHVTRHACEETRSDMEAMFLEMEQTGDVPEDAYDDEREIFLILGGGK